MIAKRIPARTQGRGFGGLARYIVDANGQSSPETWTRTADYILDTAHGGAKVSGVRVSNCDTDDAALATAAVLVVQDQYDHRPGRKSAASRSYHLVISFPPGERPPAHVLRAVEDELVQAIGYGQHQRLSAIHNDTDHLHIHVAINKVHPGTLRNVEPYFDKRRLMQTCEALELRYGLTRTNHGATTARAEKCNAAPPAMPGGVAALEAHGGQESLTRWVRENARTALLDAVKAESWQALHAAAARYGLTVKPHGAGIVIVDDASGIGVKASAVDRALSAKALTTGLGAFQSSAAHAAPEPATARYHAAPSLKHAGHGTLWAAYQRQREEALTTRGAARRTHAEQHIAYVTKLRQWYREKSAHLKQRTDLDRTAKRAAWQALFAERAADFQRERERYAAVRQQTSLDTPVTTWRDFVVRSAADGNAEAIAVQRRHDRQAGDESAQRFAASNTVAPAPKGAANRSGNAAGAVRTPAPRKPGRGR